MAEVQRERDELRVWQKTADIVISELRAEVETAKAKDEYMMSRLTFYCDLSDELRAEIERLKSLLETERRVARMIGDAHKKDAAEVERLRAALDRHHRDDGEWAEGWTCLICEPDAVRAPLANSKE